MDAGVVALLVPIAAIVTAGVVKVVKVRQSSPQRSWAADTAELEARLAAMEQDLAAMRGELGETQERCGCDGAPALRGRPCELEAPPSRPTTPPTDLTYMLEA